MVKLLVKLGRFNTVAMNTIIATIASIAVTASAVAIKFPHLILKSRKLQLADLSRLSGYG